MKKTKQDLKCENCDEPVGSKKCVNCIANVYTHAITTEIRLYNKPIRIIKSYNITIVEYEDDSTSMHRQNSNFRPFELVGILSFIKEEMLKMIFPKLNKESFTNITRTVKNCKITEIKEKK